MLAFERGKIPLVYECYVFGFHLQRRGCVLCRLDKLLARNTAVAYCGESGVKFACKAVFESDFVVITKFVAPVGYNFAYKHNRAFRCQTLFDVVADKFVCKARKRHNFYAESAFDAESGNKTSLHRSGESVGRDNDVFCRPVHVFAQNLDNAEICAF